MHGGSTAQSAFWSNFTHMRIQVAELGTEGVMDKVEDLVLGCVKSIMAGEGFTYTISQPARREIRCMSKVQRGVKALRVMVLCISCIVLLLK